MRRLLSITAIVTPFLAGTAMGQSSVSDPLLSEQAISVEAYQFDQSELDSIRYSRLNDVEPERPAADLQTRFSFRLRPSRPDFSLRGAFGLGMMFTMPEVDVQSGISGEYRLQESMPAVHSGFQYSAGFNVEHERESIDGTAYVSSSLLGLSYGRLGRVWYGGIDVNLEQFSSEHQPDASDTLSLDFTTGRRLGFTGLSADSPLWLLSLQGNFDMQDIEAADRIESAGDWYLNPSLFWQNPGFTFSAQVQVQVDRPDQTLSPDDEPDYRLRAIFEKQF